MGKVKTNLGRIVPVHRGEWDSSGDTVYEKLDIINFDESSFICILPPTTNQDPNDNTYWKYLCKSPYRLWKESDPENADKTKEEYLALLVGPALDNPLSTREYPDINDAVAVVAASQISKPSIVYTYVGGTREIKFQTKVLTISEPITLAFYQRLDGNRVIIETTPEFVGDACFICDVAGSGWIVDIENITFNTTVPAIKLFSNNLDTGLVNINKCWFYGNDSAIILETQSSIVNIEECRFIGCDKVIDSIKVDQINFSKSFILELPRSVSGSASFEFGQYTRFVSIRDSMLIPQNAAEGVIDFAWINFYGTKLTIENNNFGGESGNHTIVNWRSVPSAATPKIGKRLTLLKNELWAFLVTAVRLYTVPDCMIIENNNGFSDINYTMSWAGDAATIIAACGGIVNQIVSVKNNVGTLPVVANYILPELLPCVSERKLFNSRNLSLLPVALRPFDTVAAGNGTFNFDIGLVKGGGLARVVNIEFETQSHVGSNLYRGFFKGLALITTAYAWDYEASAMGIVYKVQVVPLANSASVPEPTGAYVVAATFGDSGQDTVGINSDLDMSITVAVTGLCISSCQYKVWETDDGTFKI